MKRFILSTMILCSCTVGTAFAQISYTDYVDPLIGSAHCRWFHVAPGALPFGMAKPGPATNAHLGSRGGWGANGYDYRDKSIEGFVLFHEFQVGGVLLMPTTGVLKTIPGDVDSLGQGYRSFFDRKDEHATAGCYSVLLKDYGIKAEMTATERVSFLRFTYPQNDKSHLLFNIGSLEGESGDVLDAYVTQTKEGLIEGWVKTYPEYVKNYQKDASVTMYFSAVVGVKAAEVGTFNGKDIVAGSTTAKGKGAGLYLTFKTKPGQTVVVKVGQSYTSIVNARLNRQTEAMKMTFDQAKTLSHQRWNEMLGRISVEGGKQEDLVKFYTGLYHGLLGRGIASDVNGDYEKNDGTIGRVDYKNGKPRFCMHNTDALWGAQWDLNQLWLLAYPECASDQIDSHIQIYKDTGWLGDGIACGKYVSGVGTNQVTALLAAAYQCGVRDFDMKAGYNASLKNEIDGENRPKGAGKIDTEYFVKYGFVPFREENEKDKIGDNFSVSHTLEYSYTSWAVAQWAKALKKEKDYSLLLDLSKGWERLFDAKSFLIVPRHIDGSIIDKFNPMAAWRGYQEGNAWQYTFYVPHDVQGLVQKVGKERFVGRLDSIFTRSRSLIFSGGKTEDAFSGLETLYNHGNQPCLHVSWLFDDAGRPDLTQKWVRAILNEFYGNEGLHGYGYGQDEDQGQLGAWYVMSAMGLFDVSGLTAINPQFSLGAPLFKKITIKTSPRYFGGKNFVIQCEGDNSSDHYVKKYILNGKTLTGYKLPFKEIVKGGKLDVIMQ
jgi:predicted alpha-1,2-mannosidase